MLYAENQVPKMASQGIVDVGSGIAIDLPLGMQETPEWWKANPKVKERIQIQREALNIRVPNDMLEAPVVSELVGDPADGEESEIELPPGTQQKRKLESKGTPGVNPPQLQRYWTAGAGLARWAAAPHPYTTLVAQLRSEGVPGKMVHGLAAKYYRRVKGHWPGKHSNDKKSMSELEAHLAYIAESKGWEQ